MDLDDLLKSIREEKDEEVPEGLDDLLSSIRGSDNKPIDVKKFVGEDKYDKYYQELLADGRIDGDNVTPDERKEGVKAYKKNKIGFEAFVDKVLEQKKSVEREGGDSSGGGGDVAGNIVGVSANPTQKLLPGTAEQPASDEEKEKKERVKIKKDPIIEKLDAILKSTTSIEQLMAKDLKLDKKLAEKERKRLEKEKGEKKEKFREGFMKKVGTSFKKLLKPAMGLFERLFKALGTMLFFGALMRIVDWVSDKENQRKLGNVFRFLSKFWPALLALYLVFGNGLTRTLLKMTGSLLKFIPKLLGLAFKLGVKAVKLLGKVPKPLLIGGALFGIGAAVPMLAPDTVVDDADKQANKSVEEQGKDKTIADLKAQNENRNPLQKFGDFVTGAGSEREEQIQRLETGEEKSYGFSGGGLIPSEPSTSHGTGGIVKGFTGGGPVRNSTFNSKKGGKNSPPKNDSISFLSGGGKVQSPLSNSRLYMSSGGKVTNKISSPTVNYLSGGGTPKPQGTVNYLSGGGTPQPQGTDTIPAMLTPGEFVMSKGAVDKIGVGNLEQMNASGGGTNKPKLLNNTMYAQGGGFAGDKNKPKKPTQTTSQEKDTDKGTKTKEEGTGGGPAVINAGKQILGKGYTVAEHPNFRKNNHSGEGPNKGVGFNASGGERVGGHSSGSLHYSDLAIDVTDWRPGDWLGRTSSLAESIFQNRKKLKVTQIIHDPWGSWFAGEGSKGGALGGHGTHLHIGFASGDTAGSIGDAANSGSGTGGAGGGGAGNGAGGGGGGGAGGGAANGGMTPVTSNVPMTGYRKDSAATLSPDVIGDNPLVRGKSTVSKFTGRGKGESNAAELSQTSPSELSRSESSSLVAAASGQGQAGKQTQSAASAKGSRNRDVTVEDPNNMVVFSNRALHNIIL